MSRIVKLMKQGMPKSFSKNLVESEYPTLYRVVLSNKPPVSKLTKQQSDTINNPCDSKHSVHLDASNFVLKVKEGIKHFISNMSSQESSPSKYGYITLPDNVRGMKILDREAFKSSAKIPGIKVPLAKIRKISKVNSVKKLMLHRPGIKPIALPENHGIPDDNSCKIILFDPCSFSMLKTLPCSSIFKENDIDLDDYELYNLDLCYENWMYNEILKAVLPETSDGIGGFTTIGHIIHLNLKDNVVDFKNIIGEVLLEKVSKAKTVVNKINIIDNTFRNFQMEVIAGEQDFITTVKEHGCTFKFDFSKVYWNSRLSTEHQRVVSLLKQGDIVYDMFAGVGPFAIPAAKKKCCVFANDLNPESYKWMKENVQFNKIKAEMYTYNLDGRDFVKDVVKPDLIQRYSASTLGSDIHIVMNLPALAIEFIDVFVGLLNTENTDKSTVRYPRVYCYGFKKADESDEQVRERVNLAFGKDISPELDIKFVRNVAPNKDMICVQFELTEEILFGEYASLEPDPKRLKCE